MSNFLYVFLSTENEIKRERERERERERVQHRQMLSKFAIHHRCFNCFVLIRPVNMECSSDLILFPPPSCTMHIRMGCIMHCRCLARSEFLPMQLQERGTVTTYTPTLIIPYLIPLFNPKEILDNFV